MGESSHFPSGRGKAHKDLEDLVRYLAAARVLVVLREGKEDEEAAARYEDENEYGGEVDGHQAKGDQQLGEILVVVQNAEDAGKEQDGVCGEDVVGTIVPVVGVDDENARDAHAVIDDEKQQDADVKYIPEAHEVERKALLGEADELIEHEAGAPKPEDELERRDGMGSADQYGKEKADQHGERAGGEDLAVARNPKTRELEQRRISGIVQYGGPAPRGDDRRPGSLTLLPGLAGEQRGRHVTLPVRPTVVYGPGRGRAAMEGVGRRVEADGAAPDSFQLLDD